MRTYLITILSFTLLGCTIKTERAEMEWSFPNCGTDHLNDNKICATRDFIAQAPRKRKKDWFAFLAAEGSSGYKGPIDQEGSILEFNNQELDMKKHVWDFSEQNAPNLIFRGHNSTIMNGIILNANIFLGFDEYSLPNFLTGVQQGNSGIDKSKNQELLNYGFLYADNTFNCKKGTYIQCEKNPSEKMVENFFINNLNIKSNNINLFSWGGGILNSKLIIKNNIYVGGSKAAITNNQIISESILENNKITFVLNKKNKSNLLDHSLQIFPHHLDDYRAIPSILYIKFSPETVIDSNTFTLTHPNPNAYAIILDHSPRVRITNNTFNGFKVPILMDQWSSIVDDKGNEIRPENLVGYGNSLHPDKYAGNVTMNRKGEIVAVK